MDETAWIVRAADVGDPASMNAAGIRYQLGRGVDADPDEAFAYYRKAAEAGDPLGMANLGRAIEAGVQRSATVALEWYRASAAAGSPTGRTLLGHAYEVGAGSIPTPQGPRRAVREYEDAAAKGNLDAMPRLAHLYEAGPFWIRDPALHEKWSTRGAERVIQLKDFSRFVPGDSGPTDAED